MRSIHEQGCASSDATTVRSNTDGYRGEVSKDKQSDYRDQPNSGSRCEQRNLQVKGELSEYNLANISEGQEVVITSKVYPIKPGQERFL